MDATRQAPIQMLLELLDLADELDGQLDEALAPLGLTPALYWLLDRAHSDPRGLDPEGSAVDLRRPREQMSALIARLSETGLLTQQTEGGPYTLSSAGAALHKRADLAVRPTAVAFESATSTNDRRALVRILSAMR